MVARGAASLATGDAARRGPPIARRRGHCYARRVFAEFTVDPRAPLARRTWRGRDMLAGLGLLAVSLLLVTLAVAAVHWRSGLDGDEGGANAVATIAFEGMFGGVVLLLARMRGLALRDLGFVRPRRWSPVLVAWGGGYAIIYVYTIMLALLAALGLDVGRFEQGNPMPGDPRSSVALLLLFGVAVLVVAPVAEELFFRGLLYRGLRGYWRLAPSLALSGLAFGVFHLNPSVMLPFTAIGALFAWANERSGSLWTSILAHAAFNGVSFAVSLLVLTP